LHKTHPLTDIIKILPDSVANQIAAGEVVQRPASAVKELLENAIDSGASEIKLIVKDAGRTLIQVMDNGCGMSDTDARLCFERHATSKIRNANDLFAIRTMGFRGEALASIAAIAHVELKTKRTEDDLGTIINIEGSKVISQEACSCNNGTSISVKNLFYNVPARRNFLRSNATETNYIIEEFQRVALVNPEIAFTLSHNGKEVFNLNKNNLKQRIISVFGNNYSQRLLNVETDSNIVKISGFLCKPEFARKTRGEQYFFVNNRFIKHPYFNHAVSDAFSELLPNDAFPSYFIFLSVDPKTIDINIHPTKTEVKFEDERSIYMILRSAVKQSLGKFSVTPSLDFDMERALDFNLTEKDGPIKIPTIKVDPYFNPFDTQKKTESYREISNKQNWEKLFTQDDAINDNQKSTETESVSVQGEQKKINVGEEEHAGKFLLFSAKFIVTNFRSGLMFINIYNARERIFYERIIANFDNPGSESQKQLYPVTVEFSHADAGMLMELKDEIRKTGLEIDYFGGTSFVVTGSPVNIDVENISELLENILEDIKNNTFGVKDDKKGDIALTMARTYASKAPNVVTNDEMQALTGELFACKCPDTSPSGKPTLFILSPDEVDKKFK
jgi:DNA mismatch repair protein MutL